MSFRHGFCGFFVAHCHSKNRHGKWFSILFVRGCFMPFFSDSVYFHPKKTTPPGPYYAPVLAGSIFHTQLWRQQDETKFFFVGEFCVGASKATLVWPVSKAWTAPWLRPPPQKGGTWSLRPEWPPGRHVGFLMGSYPRWWRGHPGLGPMQPP